MDMKTVLHALIGAGKPDLARRLKTALDAKEDLTTMEALAEIDSDLHGEVAGALEEIATADVTIPEERPEADPEPELEAEAKPRITAEPDPTPKETPPAHVIASQNGQPAQVAEALREAQELKAELHKIRLSQWQASRESVIDGLRRLGIGKAQIELLETQFPADTPAEPKVLAAYVAGVKKAHSEARMQAAYNHGGRGFSLQESDVTRLQEGTSPTERLLASFVATLTPNGRTVDLCKVHDDLSGESGYCIRESYDDCEWHPARGRAGILGAPIQPFRNIGGAPSVMKAAYEIFLAEHGRPPANFQESISTSTFTGLLRDALNVRLKSDWPRYPFNNPQTGWPAVCSNIKAVSDFNTQYVEAIGGHGDPPSVSEGNDYTAATSPSTEEEVNYTVAKYGYLEDVTIETLRNDKTGKIAKIPDSMGRGASRVIYKLVYHTLIGANPTYDGDSVSLIDNATHGNIVTTAASEANLESLRLKMAKQTEPNSGEVLAIQPRILLFGPDLAETVYQLLTSTWYPESATNVGTMPVTVRALNLRQIEVPTWVTSAIAGTTIQNDYFMVADPSQHETIELAFLDGKQMPEIFLDNDPNSGSMFTSDKMTFKTRVVVGGDVLDYRSFAGGIVA